MSPALNRRAQPSRPECVLSVAEADLVADCAGALYWPDEGVLVVADLHLEKGSSYAARGVLLPPYDTAATLARLAHVHRALRAARRDRARRQLPRRRRDRRGSPTPTARRCARSSAGATGSGSPATTIPSRPTGIGGSFGGDARRSAR